MNLPIPGIPRSPAYKMVKRQTEGMRNKNKENSKNKNTYHTLHAHKMPLANVEMKMLLNSDVTEVKSIATASRECREDILLLFFK